MLRKNSSTTSLPARLLLVLHISKENVRLSSMMRPLTAYLSPVVLLLSSTKQPGPITLPKRTVPSSGKSRIWIAFSST